MNRYTVDAGKRGVIDNNTAEIALMYTLEAAEMFAEDLNNGAYAREDFIWAFIKEDTY